MAEIDPFIRVVLLRALSDPSLPSSFRRRDELLSGLRTRIKDTLAKEKVPDGITDLETFSENFFDELLGSGVIIQEDHRFAGSYFFFVKDKYLEFRNNQLSRDPINRDSERVGARYFGDVFSGYLATRSADDVEEAGRGMFPIPASDRIVSIGDNSEAVVAEIEGLKRAVLADNDESGILDGRRDRIVAELSAGQSLLRAPSVRVRALYSVLLTTLGFIATEFAGGVIGDLAVKLIDQLKPLIGL